MAQSKYALGYFYWPKQTERRNIMRGKKKGVHKVATKTKGHRKLAIHGGFKAMEHKVGHKKGRRKSSRRKRA